MREQTHKSQTVFLLIFACLPFVSFAQVAQKMFIQSITNNYVVFEAEDYTQINTIVLSSPYWQGTADAAASGGSALETMAGGMGAAGSGLMEPNRAQYMVKAAVGGNYSLYVRAKNTSSNQNHGFLVSSSLNSLMGEGISVDNDNLSSYRWVKASSIFALTVGQTAFIGIAPDGTGVFIDKVVLHTNPGLSSAALDLLAPQAIECLSPAGELSRTNPGDTLAVQTPVDPDVSFIRPTQTNYFSVSGRNVVSLECYDTPCNAQVTYGTVRVSCYNGIVTPANPIQVCFNWYTYNPENQEFIGDGTMGDNIRVRVLFDNGAIVSLPSIPGNTLSDPTYQDRFNQYCAEITSLPQVGANFPITAQVEITLEGGVKTGKSAYVWIDNILFQLDNASLAADADFFINDLLDPEITFGNMSGPGCTPDPMATCCDLGNGFDVCYEWDFGDGNTFNGILDEVPHTYSTDGTFQVKLTVTVAGNVPGCENTSILVKPVTVDEALPVTLTRFTARPEKQDVHLSWETATEINNDYFLVEHSQDGIAFQALTRVEGSGDSQAPLDYRWIHEGAPAGVNYYRLKQVDFDGTHAYSDVVSVRIAAGAEIRLFPNPTRDAVQVVTGREEQMSYFIYDSFGRILRRGIVASQGTIELSGLAPGVYQARLESTAGALLAVERIVKTER